VLYAHGRSIRRYDPFVGNVADPLDQKVHEVGRHVGSTFIQSEESPVIAIVQRRDDLEGVHTARRAVAPVTFPGRLPSCPNKLGLEIAPRATHQGIQERVASKLVFVAFRLTKRPIFGTFAADGFEFTVHKVIRFGDVFQANRALSEGTKDCLALIEFVEVPLFE
jgi:hypothetical protein